MRIEQRKLHFGPLHVSLIATMVFFSGAFFFSGRNRVNVRRSLFLRNRCFPVACLLQLRGVEFGKSPVLSAGRVVLQKKLYTIAIFRTFIFEKQLRERRGVEVNLNGAWCLHMRVRSERRAHF